MSSYIFVLSTRIVALHHDAICALKYKQIMFPRALTLNFDGFRVLTFVLSEDYWYRGRAEPVLD